MAIEHEKKGNGMADKKKHSEGLMRLDKFLAEMGKGSRSEVKEMARRGRIQINGQTVKAADTKVDPERDQICLDGLFVSYARTEYFMLNKPQGTVSATEDGRYPTVVSLIGEALRKDLFPVGRLDVDTEGLLLITNDGPLAHELLSPKNHVDKTYLAYIEGELPADAGRRLEEGICLEDGVKTRPAKLSVLSCEKGECLRGRPADGALKTALPVALTIHEGKFHQVKRMFEAMRCRVVYLKRLSMGPLTLDTSLLPGQYRPLTAEEQSALKRTNE